MLSDRDRQVLARIEHQFLAEDPEFVRSFQVAEEHLERHGFSWWMYTLAIGLSAAMSGLMVLAGLPLGALMFGATIWGLWVARRAYAIPATGKRAAAGVLAGPAPGSTAARRSSRDGANRVGVVSTRDERAPIVVGVDGSASGQEALDWAIAEATARLRPLRIVQAFNPPVTDGPLGPTPGGALDGALRAAAALVLQQAEAHARSAAPELDVCGRLVVGAATQALLKQAEDAEVLVLGGRALGRFASVLVGSVGVEVVSQASCPVVIMRPGPSHGTGPSTGRIVVGVVDDAQRSSPAIQFAFQLAARRGVGVTAVHAWTPHIASYAGCHLAPAVAEVHNEEEDRQQLLLDALARERRNSPSVEVRLKLVRGSPSQALVGESTGAELVVVGSQHRGTLRGRMPGSVSQTLLRHADCPVAVVHTATPTTPH